MLKNRLQRRGFADDYLLSQHKTNHKDANLISVRFLRALHMELAYILWWSILLERRRNR
jgi:hypothetical protein